MFLAPSGHTTKLTVWAASVLSSRMLIFTVVGPTPAPSDRLWVTFSMSLFSWSNQ